MPEEILPNLFRIKIPLPNNPLRYLNSYIIRDSKRSLIIDTGLNQNECLAAMLAGLEHLCVDLNNVDFFITHFHADHMALLSKLKTDSSRIFLGRIDKAFLDAWEGFEPILALVGQNGFPQDELRTAMEQHPAYKHGSDSNPTVIPIDDGDEIDYGGYHFNCILTAGHTPGHICLYEPLKKVLVAGDHILADITPTIQCWRDDQNPLKLYLASLSRIFTLEADLVLPGHRKLIYNHRDRIEQLRNHHSQRLDEILAILEKESMSAFQVAARMRWDLQVDRWEDFPVTQKWFATGEALAHLRFLEETGKLIRTSSQKVTTFSSNRVVF